MELFFFVVVNVGNLVTTKSRGPGKTMYTFSATFRFLLRPFSVLPAGGGGGGQAETESLLALAENVYVILPTPKE